MNDRIRSICNLLLCLILTLTLASCAGKKPEYEGPISPDAAEGSSPLTAEETADALPADGAAVVPGGKSISPAKALKIYQKAVRDIKTQAPGFTRLDWQSFSEIDAGDVTGIASGILSILAKNLVRRGSESEALADPDRVAKGDGAAATEKFPLFGSSSAYAETDDGSFLYDAKYVKGDGYKEYYLFFTPEIDPASGGKGMGSLISPFDREGMLESVRTYVPAVDPDSLRLDCVYSGCYLMFRVDGRGKLLRLENHLYSRVYAAADIDIVVASAEVFRGSCKLEEHYVFTDFEY